MGPSGLFRPSLQPFKYATAILTTPNRGVPNVNHGRVGPVGLAALALEGLTSSMRITKHEHAALRLEHDGQTLLIDPGTFTAPLDGLSGVVAVVITHEHPDHWTAAHLQQILQEVPGIPILSTAGVASAASEATPAVLRIGMPGASWRICCRCAAVQ